MLRERKESRVGDVEKKRRCKLEIRWGKGRGLGGESLNKEEKRKKKHKRNSMFRYVKERTKNREEKGEREGKYVILLRSEN